jgi:2-iminobutanoate/2-iminopropanoate deaminase
VAINLAGWHDMPKRVIETNLLMRPIAHFSHAARVGDLIHIGATAGTDAQRRLAGVTPGQVDFAAQARQMFDNLETVLKLVDARPEDVVHVKTYVTDPRDIAAYRNLYSERLGKTAANHVVVGSHEFPLPQAALEIDVVAVADAKARHLQSPDGSGALGVLAGDTFYCTALPCHTGKVVAGGTSAQSRQVLDTLKAMLSAVSFSLKDVVNIHITLSDVRHFAEFEAVYRGAFAAPYPTRCVVTAPLENVGYCLQIEATAVQGGGRPIGSPGDVQESASAAMLAGDTLYISGHTGAARGGDCNAQTRVAWARINDLVAAAGFAPDSILRTNNVLTDWRSYADFNGGYGANVRQPYPPRATVLGSLLDPAALVQIEAIAHRNGSNATIVQVPGAP